MGVGGGGDGGDGTWRERERERERSIGKKNLVSTTRIEECSREW